MFVNHPTSARRAAPALLALALFCTALAPAADWPHWRGPQRNGISAESGWLDVWPAAGPAIAWKAKVGLGFSSFVIAQGRVFTLGHANGQDTVWCFDAATGKVVWTKNVQKETGAPIPDWGFTGAPLVHENLLVLNVGDAGLALDQSTGKILWQSAKKAAGYSTPLPVQRDGQWLALLGTGSAYVAVNLRDGKETWRTRWITEYGVNASDPIVDGDRMFLSTGYGKGGGLFKLGAAEPEPLWKTKKLRTQLNPAVLYQGHLYGTDGDTSEKAALKCLDFATGDEKWTQPGFGSGAVTIADGKLIALGGTGELMVAPATPSGFKPTARAQVLGGKCWTAPVLANGRVYARNGRGDVVCVNLGKN